MRFRHFQEFFGYRIATAALVLVHINPGQSRVVGNEAVGVIYN